MTNQFSLEAMTAVTIMNVNVRSELHGDDHVPAADISVRLNTSNHILSEFDGSLRSMLYKAVEASQQQGQLEGVEPISDMPLLRTTNLEQPLRLANEFMGYSLTIDRGLGGGSNVVVGDVAINKVRADCKEGGTVDLLFRLQASKLSADVIGKLATLIGCETKITLMPPVERQAPIDGTVVAFEREIAAKNKRTKGKDATDIFAEQHGGAA
jgi:hypothetical protein